MPTIWGKEKCSCIFVFNKHNFVNKSKEKQRKAKKNKKMPRKAKKNSIKIAILRE